MQRLRLMAKKAHNETQFFMHHKRKSAFYREMFRKQRKRGSSRGQRADIEIQVNRTK